LTHSLEPLHQVDILLAVFALVPLMWMLKAMQHLVKALRNWMMRVVKMVK